MKISTNTVVEFSYELEVDGQIVDQTTKERPLDYIHGTNSLLPKLEEHIEGIYEFSHSRLGRIVIHTAYIREAGTYASHRSDNS